jgi:ADP-ribosylglycohydrolase
VNTGERRQRTLQSLAGLSVGDAFGQQFFTLSPRSIAARQLPRGPWHWTDDTHMSLSIVEVLLSHDTIEPDILARRFAARYAHEPWRGYGGGAQRLLMLYAWGADWRKEAARLFDGGSYGNGAAMRAAPIGAFFAGEPEQAAKEAQRSAMVTHAHLEGQAGAMAVTVAAAIASSREPPTGAPFLRQVLPYVPPSRTREGVTAATHIGAHEHTRGVSSLGTGYGIAAFDTVPFCLWVVAHHAVDFETALWTTVAGLGDRDTTCAIVGGIVAQLAAIPPTWLARREPLPEGFEI